MDMAKSDFLRCVGTAQTLIENAERFALIDLDRSRFEKGCITMRYNDTVVVVGVWCKTVEFRFQLCSVLRAERAVPSRGV